MDYLQQLVNRYPSLIGIQDAVLEAYQLMVTCFEGNGKLLAAGNGGSAADADHIVGELMKGFVKKRTLPADFISRLTLTDAETGNYIGQHIQGGLPAIALSSHPALMTAWINDMDSELLYAQQVYGYGTAGDIFLGISTSGNSKNMVYAMITAKAKKLKTIALTGGSGGSLMKYADVSIVVPEKETYKVQELHLPIYHTVCLMLEEHFFS
jgi:D-sedoheptulose 7-phosphate isomerase